MNVLTLQVNGEQYPVKFGFGSNRILGEKWNIKTYGGVLQAVSKSFQFPKDAEPSMDQYVKIGDLVQSGILYMTPEAPVSSDQVVEALFDDIEKLQAIIEMYLKSMPKSMQAAPQQQKNAKRVKK